jgi:O-antigen/teichoic acid export membrane protein
LITIDQAVAGASNVLVALLAARLLGVSSFGLFGIVFLAYVVLQGVSRALVSDPLLVHPVEAQERPAEVIATSSLLGLALAAITIVTGLGARHFSHDLGGALIVLGVCLPLLVLQDLGRYLGFATQRPQRSLLLDTAWLVLVFAAVAVLVVLDVHSLVAFIAVWAGTGALSGLLLFWQYPDYRPRLTISFLKYTWHFSWRYLVSYGATQGTALTTSSVVGAIVGTRQLGGVQGTILLVRPFGTFQIAAVAACITEVSRAPEDQHRARHHAVRTTTVAGTVAVLNAVVLVFLPDALGKLVLGATWSTAKPLLLPTAVQIVFLGLMTGGRAAMLGMRLIRRAIVVDVIGAVVYLTATISGSVIDGASGALWAVAIGQGALAVTWWIVMVAHTRPQHRARHSGPAGDEPASGAPSVTELPAPTDPEPTVTPPLA